MSNFKDLKAIAQRELSNPAKKEKFYNFIYSLKEFNNIESLLNLTKLIFELEEFKHLRSEHIYTIIDSYLKNRPSQKSIITDKIFQILLEVPFENSIRSFTYIFNHGYYSEEDFESFFTINQIQNLCFNRLDTYAIIGNNIEVAYDLLYQCWFLKDKDTQIVHLSPDALKIMRRFIEGKAQCDFFRYWIRPYMWPVNAKSYKHPFTVEPYTEAIFENWINFEDFIFRCEKENLCQELIDGIFHFYQDFKLNDYKPIGLKEDDFHKYGGLLDEWILKEI